MIIRNNLYGFLAAMLAMSGGYLAKVMAIRRMTRLEVRQSAVGVSAAKIAKSVPHPQPLSKTQVGEPTQNGGGGDGGGKPPP